MQITLSFELDSYKRTDGKQMILIRITENRKHTRVSTGVSVHKSFWNKEKKEIRKNHPQHHVLNQQILKKKDEQIDNIKLEENRKQKGSTIIKYYQYFINQYSVSIDASTAKHWKSRLKTLSEFLFESLKQVDIPIADIKERFAVSYYNWHLSKGNGKSHAHRAVFSLKKVLKQATNDGLILKNPFNDIKFEKSKQGDIVFLHEHEIETLDQCDMYDRSQRRTLDVFLFQCFTGMAYNEVFNFDVEKHLRKENGVPFIFIERGKTKEFCRIPLLPQAKVILEKYENKLPVFSNVKMNEYIKEVARIAELRDPNRITTHVGRRTAGTYLLNKGVPMLTVAKILGHKSVRTTEKYYAHLLTSSIYNEVSHLM